MDAETGDSGRTDDRELTECKLEPFTPAQHTEITYAGKSPRPLPRG